MADEEFVAALQHNSAERGDKRLDVELCLVFRLADGRVIEAWEHYGDLYAWDEFWS